MQDEQEMKKVFQKTPNQNIYPENLIKRDLIFAHKSSLLIYFDIQGISRGNHYSYIVNDIGEKHNIKKQHFKRNGVMRSLH